MGNNKMCHNCKEHHFVKTLHIKDRHCGSIFDGDDTEINLCLNCMDLLDVDESWFDNEQSSIVSETTGLISYINERYITLLINNLPLESQEEILNKPNKYFKEVMSTEDWLEEYKNGFFNL